MSDNCIIDVVEQGRANFSGVLTFESTPSLFRKTEALFSANPPVTSVDLSGVTEVDSTGLALLLEWQATQRAASRSLQIFNAPSSLMSLAHLCDAMDLLNMSGRNHDE